MKRIKQIPCRDCGLPVTVGANQRLPPRHPDCGIAARVAQMIQMHEKNGPEYEKWKAAMVRFVKRECMTDGGSG